MLTERREGYKFGVQGRSKLTLELMGEHKLIVADFELLMTSVQLPQGNGPPDKAALFHRLAQSLNEHFMKEERLLFPLLTRWIGSRICVKLRNEHAEMMAIATNSNKHLSPPEESLWQLGRLLHAHIWTEENILFWYLDVHEPLKAERSLTGL
jgi:hemerythrin-like domain-containing protein